MLILHGISNCDTVRKARRWLDAHSVDYRFHDFRKNGVEATMLNKWVKKVGWETLVNRRGTTWRQLDDKAKNITGEKQAVALMCAQPAVIKRPVLTDGQRVHVGFTEADYRAFVAKKSA